MRLLERTGHCTNIYKGRPTLSAAKMYANDSSFYKYKVYADIRGDSSDSGVDSNFWRFRWLLLRRAKKKLTCRRERARQLTSLQFRCEILYSEVPAVLGPYCTKCTRHWQAVYQLSACDNDFLLPTKPLTDCVVGRVNNNYMAIHCSQPWYTANVS